MSPADRTLQVAAEIAQLLIPVQVVNYFNPWRGWIEVGKAAVESAEPNALQSLAVVDIPHLVALKLYAGGRKSELDVLELLERVGLASELEAVLARR